MSVTLKGFPPTEVQISYPSDPAKFENYVTYFKFSKLKTSMNTHRKNYQ